MSNILFSEASECIPLGPSTSIYRIFSLPLLLWAGQDVHLGIHSVILIQAFYVAELQTTPKLDNFHISSCRWIFIWSCWSTLTLVDLWFCLFCFKSCVSICYIFILAPLLLLALKPLLLSSCLLDKDPRHLGGGNLSWRIASIRLACQYVCGTFFLVVNWVRRIHLTVGILILKQVGLSSLRRAAEHVRESKLVINVPHGLWFSSCQ